MHIIVKILRYMGDRAHLSRTVTFPVFKSVSNYTA